LLCRKSVKCQHPWQKATSSRLLCSAVSCGILAQVLLALPQFVIVGSGRRPCAPTQPSDETHLRQHHDGSGDWGGGGTSIGLSDVRTHSNIHSAAVQARAWTPDGTGLSMPTPTGRQSRLTGHEQLRTKLSHTDVSLCRSLGFVF